MSGHSVSLPADFTGDAVFDLKVRVLALLQQISVPVGQVKFDGAAVERIGTPGLQLLQAAALSIRKWGGDFALTAPSEVLELALKATAIEFSNNEGNRENG